MAISVRRLSRNIQKEYGINLLSGLEGMDNKVKWVHIIEDYDVAKFLRGNELILCTGIGNLKDEDNLMTFIEKLHENGASGLMINIGPYIDKIPPIVVRYCNDVKLPLFTIPWEVRLVDLTQAFCKMIIESEEKAQSLTSLVKDYILKNDKSEKTFAELTRNGFSQHLNYCIMDIGIVGGNETEISNKKLESLHEVIEREINKKTSNFVLFKNGHKYVSVIGGLRTPVVREIVEEIKDKYIGDRVTKNIIVSNNRENLAELGKNFAMAEKMYKLCLKLGQNVMFFDDLGFYKILLGVNDKKIMKDYEKSILGALIEYDESNGSDFLPFIKEFIANDCNVQQVANAMFVHRNTIHYKINKIKDISGLSLSNMNDLFKIKLCLMILNL